MRWYGPGYDSVTLEQIRQIPGVTGVITTLYGTTPGEVWTKEEVANLKKVTEDAGLHISGIESVNIHTRSRVGLPTRDQYIENYIQTLTVLGEAGIDLGVLQFHAGV